MNAKAYMKDRVDDQISWYERKSASNKKWFYMAQITVLVASACIPVLAIMTLLDVQLFRLIIGVFGAIVTIATGIASLCKYHEHWYEYRKVAESLKHEKYMYATAKGPYTKGDKYAVLVERVEALISQENTAWHQRLKTKN